MVGSAIQYHSPWYWSNTTFHHETVLFPQTTTRYKMKRSMKLPAWGLNISVLINSDDIIKGRQTTLQKLNKCRKFIQHIQLTTSLLWTILCIHTQRNRNWEWKFNSISFLMTSTQGEMHSNHWRDPTGAKLFFQFMLEFSQWILGESDICYHN